MIFLQIRTVCSRASIETISPWIAYNLNEVLIACQVLGKNSKMEPFQIFVTTFFVFRSILGHIQFTPEDRLERALPFLFPFDVNSTNIVEKLHHTKHITIISNSNTWHSVFDGCIHQFPNTGASIHYWVMGMDIQMYESICFHVLSILIFLRKVNLNLRQMVAEVL